MSFASSQYGIFLAAICVLVFVLPSRFVPLFLLAASLFFYASGNIPDLLTLGAVILVSYSAGRVLARKASLTILWLCILPTLGPLIWFKYVRGGEAIPAGISFFTLQALAYVVDVYRAQAQVETDLPRYALFLSFFPLVLSGPIERAAHLLPQLARPGAPQLSKGLFRILRGVVLKCVFANSFGIFVNATWEHLANARPSNALLADYLYAFQIYCDFYGYTLIAMGSAAVLGIELVNNFDNPYTATNIQEFWSRWHISLTNWLRDYIYFPLGGLRKPLNRYRNLLLTWLIAGAWHGAAITFLIWGALHGIALSVYHFSRVALRQKLPAGGWVPSVVRALGWLVTFHFVVLAWVPFRASSWAQARMMLSKIREATAAISAFSPADPQLVFLLRLAAVFVILEFFDRLAGMERLFLRAPMLVQAAWLALWCCAMYLAPITNVKFIYVQF